MVGFGSPGMVHIISVTHYSSNIIGEHHLSSEAKRVNIDQTQKLEMKKIDHLKTSEGESRGPSSW